MLGWSPEFSAGHTPRILCLGAHSDDIEIGCGATLFKLTATIQPLEICWVVFSGNKNRALEGEESAEFWLKGVTARTIRLHDFHDGFFPGEWASIKDVFEQLKQSFEPDLIFTHYRKDQHQDHRIINELTWNTFRNHSILEYEIPKYDGDLHTPNCYVSLSSEAVHEKVSGLMRFFGSQSSRHWFCEELFLGLMRIRGMECGSDSGYAEGFHVRKTNLEFQ